MVLTSILVAIGVALVAVTLVVSAGAAAPLAVWVSIVIGLAIYALVPTQGC